MKVQISLDTVSAEMRRRRSGWLAVCLSLSVLLFQYLFFFFSFFSLWVSYLYLYLSFSLCMSVFICLIVWIFACVCLSKPLYIISSFLYHHHLAYLVCVSVPVPASVCVFMACVHAYPNVFIRSQV